MKMPLVIMSKTNGEWQIIIIGVVFIFWYHRGGNWKKATFSSEPLEQNVITLVEGELLVG
jgi:hypothetical protein